MTTGTSAQTMAGTAISVSSALPATHDVSGFSALSYTLLGLLTDFDQVPSRVYDEVEFAPLATREKVRLKGLYVQNTIAANMADDVSDAGQTLLKAGLKSDSCYSIEIRYQNGDKDYFTGLISDFSKTGGDGNTIIGRSLAIIPAGDTQEIRVSGVLTASILLGGTFTGITDGSFAATQASTDGAGIGAEFQVTMVAGTLTAISLINASGSGYIATEIITLAVPGPTETVAATVTVDSVLTV